MNIFKIIVIELVDSEAPESDPAVASEASDQAETLPHLHLDGVAFSLQKICAVFLFSIPFLWNLSILLFRSSDKGPSICA